jgi:hypothetical protein
MSKRLQQTLQAMAQIHGRDLNDFAAEMLARDLSNFGEKEVLHALERCRLELRVFPSVAEVIARIQDGRPGPEEAWALLPKNESDTAVWTDEMRGAWGAARDLIDEDPIAARMAFREVYARLLAEARSGRKPVRWGVTLGFDKTRRASALKEAIEQGRVTQAQVQALLPEYGNPIQAPRITGPAEPELSTINPAEILAQIKKSISRES